MTVTIPKYLEDNCQQKLEHLDIPSAPKLICLSKIKQIAKIIKPHILIRRHH